jgi:hypothetical protein
MTGIEPEETYPLICSCFCGFLQQLLHALYVQLLVDFLENLVTLFEAM